MTRGAWLAAAAVCVAACAGPGDGRLTVHGAYAVPGAGLAPGVLYARIDNRTATPDTLLGIEAASAEIMLHTGGDATGRAAMAMAGPIPVAARATVSLAPGGLHGMITTFPRDTHRGDSVSVTFRFARAGAIAVYARVIDYADVDTAVPQGRR